jgi:NADPH:quinone reductase-like Zn-dependent oxidoreductase
VLQVREHPDPEPKEGALCVAVEAAGLNFAEVTARQGLYPDAPKAPCIVGYEAAGVVESVGPGVKGFKVGDRVLGMTRFGGHAEKVLMTEDVALRMPDAMSFAEAAAIPVVYLTAHHMLFYIGTVHPKSSVLIHAAAGGVGIAVLQLLRTVPELTIFGTASKSKHGVLRELGCTHPIDYHSEDYAAEVMRLTGGRGVDLALEALGGPDTKKTYALLAKSGRMVCFGFANAISGSRRNMFHVVSQFVRIPRFNAFKMTSENRGVAGVYMGSMWDQAAVLKPQLERVIRFYQEGVVKPHVHAAIPFSRAAEAHEMLEQRKNVGKVVLVPER